MRPTAHIAGYGRVPRRWKVQSMSRRAMIDHGQDQRNEFYEVAEFNAVTENQVHDLEYQQLATE